ncbi:MAG: hypothetical protein J6K37_04645 [Lachnospiraceae bacterium]|nr:hypothetical protein [Lachnospiraceae bacterium]
MKKMKKLLAVLMIMVLAMSLCGCGNTAEKLYGSWEMTVDLSSEIESELDEPDFHAAWDVKMILQFNEDGTIEMYADEEFTTESLNGWLDAYIDYTVEQQYAEYEEMGKSREEVDQAFMDQYGMGMKEMLEEAMAESVSVEDVVAELYVSGVWEAKGDKLYLDEDEVQANAYNNFTVEGDTLTITIPEGAEVDASDMMEGMEYPLVFTKVATAE